MGHFEMMPYKSFCSYPSILTHGSKVKAPLLPGGEVTVRMRVAKVTVVIYSWQVTQLCWREQLKIYPTVNRIVLTDAYGTALL
jgi:hypothetical protein